MIYDEYISPEEKRLIETLKGKTLSDKDQIIYEYEKRYTNDALRNVNPSTGTVRTVTE